ncbi:Predicted arabinose efflux permease, MFS family [Mucilaginibacter gossypiicola]|uniref:Predicted arabinose efflux permease, MFS family n=1 Tax=Mucilaginibacter gossypiicola TaxID=551995 RepID=A0A1H8IAK5_9SPHI|nr:MFS transporter [Mucilaginibacter gossypiicola]SEN65076.1 Predicted arabinose efflux permease, MFS family [Mucilaginibacter gossypiicola]
MSTVKQAIPTIKPADVKPYNNIFGVLITIFGMIFLEFLVMGISLGVLPDYVHSRLGFSNLMVGVVIGLQYAATLCTRHFAGKMADTKGGRQAVVIGILLSALSGIFCIVSGLAIGIPSISLLALIAGRILLGIGESYLVIGVFAWGFILVGPQNTGRVMVWNGMGMYGGMACGAPLGIWLQSQSSITTSFAAIALLPIVSLLAMRMLPRVILSGQVKRLPFYKAVGLVWKSGTGLALASIGFGGIASFITLFFIQQSWQGASFAITAFGAGYIVVRIFFAGLPDRFGGARVAMISLLVEVAGQLLIWSATSGLAGILGAGLTGIGMSLVFPSFGTIAVKRVSAENRGMAMAAYNAFFDLGIGLTAPIAGLIAGKGHYSNIYLLGALTAAVSALLAYLEYKKDKVVFTNNSDDVIEMI